MSATTHSRASHVVITIGGTTLVQLGQAPSSTAAFAQPDEQLTMAENVLGRIG